MRPLFFPVSLLVAATLATPSRAGLYQLDDDDWHQSLAGFGACHPVWCQTAAWLNGFQVVPGMETIDEIHIAHGYPEGPDGRMPLGIPYSAFLWTDPTNDGNPADAIVARSVATVVMNSFTPVLDVVPITPITLNLGDWFYAGAMITVPGQFDFAIALDLDGTPTNSWLAGWASTTPDANNLGGAEGLIQEWVWVVRAHSPTAIPEPSSWLLSVCGFAILAAVSRRRRIS